MHRYSRLVRQLRPVISMSRESFLAPRNIKSVSIPTTLKVNLTPQEKQLCNLLDGCRVDLLSKGIDVECRIAGGWVRDKVIVIVSFNQATPRITMIVFVVVFPVTQHRK